MDYNRVNKLNFFFYLCNSINSNVFSVVTLEKELADLKYLQNKLFLKLNG